MVSSDVRPLRGEDLEYLAWAGPLERARSLDEAVRLVGRVDEFDYLAACAGDRVVAIGAAGYRTPFGAASLASLSVDPETSRLAPGLDPTELLLAWSERRAWELTCTSIEVRVEAEDIRSRATLEVLGYGLVGATTAATGSGRTSQRHVDSWVLRKEL